MLSASRLTSFFKKWWLPLLFCVVLPTAVVGSVIQRHSQFSPIDEQAHFDYVERLYSHGLPAVGDPLMESTLKEIACRGTALPGIVTPPCNSATFTAKDFPGEGFQYEAQQPPLYYAVAAPIAKVMEKVMGLGSVGSARLIGVLLLIGGLLLSWHVAQLMKIPRLTSLAGIAVMGLSPTVVYYSAIVNNDSAGILCGALVCYVAALAHTQQRSYAKYALVVGVVCAFTKSVFILPAVIIGLAMVAVSLYQAGGIGVLTAKDKWMNWRQLPSTKTYAHTGSAFIASSLICTLVWTIVMRAYASISLSQLPTFQALRGTKANVGNVLEEATHLLSPLTGLYHPFQYWNQDVFSFLNTIALVAIVAGCAAGVFIETRQWWAVLGPLVLLGLFIGGIAMGVGFWSIYHFAPTTEPRYALSMVPVLVLILCAGIQRATAQKVFALGAFAFSAMSVWMIIQTPLV
jgi:hypothetical protein